MSEAIPLDNKKELQSLIGKINFMNRFIANSASKLKAFSPLLRLKQAEEVIWGSEQQRAFDRIKQCLATKYSLTKGLVGLSWVSLGLGLGFRYFLFDLFIFYVIFLILFGYLTKEVFSKRPLQF